MSHSLSSDVKDFVSLEHVDPGSPKTTNLDEALTAGLQKPVVGLSAGSTAAARDESTNKPEPEAKPATSDQDKSGQSEPRQFETIKRRLEKIEMDREDVVTVRYFPITLTQESTSSKHQQTQPNESTCVISQSKELKGLDGESTRTHWYSNQNELRDELNGNEVSRHRGILMRRNCDNESEYHVCCCLVPDGLSVRFGLMHRGSGERE